MYAAALFEVLGTDFAEVFFNSLDTNKVTMLSSNGEVRRRVAAGDFAFGVADTDDFKHGTGILGWLRGLYGHSHSIAEKTDSAMESNERGILGAEDLFNRPRPNGALSGHYRLFLRLSRPAGRHHSTTLPMPGRASHSGLPSHWRDAGPNINSKDYLNDI